MPAHRTRRNRSRPRARTHNVEALRALVRAYADLFPPHDEERPRTRAECPEERPCPWWSCRYHLGADVARNGSLKINHPDLEPWELTESCALDVAERGGVTLEEVGELLNLTRERVRQVVDEALGRVMPQMEECA